MDFLKLFGYATLCLVFYNEFAIYWLNYLSWPSSQLPDNHYKSDEELNKPLRLLLVADPQLIGENDEPWWYGWLARWDCDRYLRNTFAFARMAAQPDAVLYLGDLFDEGLKATDAQFMRYFQRFNSVYPYKKMRREDKIGAIFISGDNDVGGEYWGDRTDKLCDRFESYFGPLVDSIESSVVNDNNNHKNEELKLLSSLEAPFVRIIKLDLDYSISFYNSVKRAHLVKKMQKKKKIAKLVDPDQPKFTIILNHMTMLHRNRQELSMLNADTGASLIIKGDSHHVSYSKFNYDLNRITEHFARKEIPGDFLKFKLEPSGTIGDDENENVETLRQKIFHELSVPTCSYRMGVPNMGHSVMTITPQGEVYVSVLWSPDRFRSLFTYVAYLLVVTAFMLAKFVRHIAANYSSSYHHVPRVPSKSA